MQKYLGKVQPVGWLEEMRKLEDMTSAQNYPHLIGAESWQVKMRMLNRDLVLPRQVSQLNIAMISYFLQSLLFNNDNTLQGFKLIAYVLVKILKFCTGSSAKSYQCKFALNNMMFGYVLTKRHMTPGELGSLIKEVIHYKTLRGKFSSVHPELRRKGIIKVEVGEEGLRFIRDKGAFNRYIFRILLQSCFR